MILDAHIHLPVTSESFTYAQAKAQLLADLRKDGTQAAIVIPDNLAGSPIGDLPTCLSLFKDTPQVFLLGTIDIETQGQPWIDTLDGLMAARQIVGMKIFPGHDPIYPTDPRLAPVYALCQRRGAPMVIHTGWNSNQPEAAQYNDPKYIAAVARQYPALKIVIAHLFFPKVAYCYEQTHAFANIYYDTSGLADPEVVQATGAGQIEEVLLKLLAENPRKVLFGTDYAMCSRPAHLDLIDALPVAAEVRQRILWHNAVEVFKIDERILTPASRILQ